MDIMERLETNLRSYSRSFPIVFDRAKMSYMYSGDKRYLDFFAGSGTLNYGHNNDYIKAKIIEYIENDGITHALDMFTTAKSAFYRDFEDKILKPRAMDYKLFSSGPTGANAVETALKLARKATGRSGIFAFTGSYHGASLAALSVTSGRAFRDSAGVSLNDVTFIPHPYDYRHDDLIDYIEFMMTDDFSGIAKPAAIIMETVQADGGVRVMNPDFIVALRKLCTKYGVLLIVDDIQAGCGRTGTFFSFDDCAIIPDIVTLSKSVSGYGFPMSLVLINPIADVLNPGQHTGTFRGNQLAFIGARAALELRDAENLDAKTVENSEIIRDFAASKILPLDDRLQLRGKGMLFGIDFAALGGGELCGRISRECFERGLIIERVGKDDCVLKLIPALTITQEQLLQGLEIIEKAVKLHL